MSSSLVSCQWKGTSSNRRRPPERRLRSQTGEIRGTGEVFVTRSQHENSLRQGFSVEPLVSSQILMCHHAWPMYFMPYSPSSSSCFHLPQQILNLYLLPRKKKRETTLVNIMFHSFFFLFLLEFLICKRADMYSHHSLMWCFYSGWHATIKAHGGICVLL